MNETAGKSGCGSVATIIVLLFVAFIAYLGYANHRGESGAQAVCDSISVGDTLASVRAKMAAAKGSRRGVQEVHEEHEPSFRDNPNFIYVEFPGIGLERYSCVADLSKDKVTNVRVMHLD